MSRTAAPAPTAEAGHIPAQQPPSAGPSASVSWQARRRRPGLLALAAACIAACALGNYWYWTENGQRVPVLVMAHEVPAGTVIREADLAEASVALDPALKAIGAGQRGEVVGKRASVQLLPGALLSPKQVTSRTLVKPGEQLVGMSLRPGQLPDSELRPNDRVQVVFTSDEGGTASGSGKAAGGAQAGPVTIDARILRVGPKRENTDERVIDVIVPKADGPKLAAQTASGDVALAVDGAGS